MLPRSTVLRPGGRLVGGLQRDPDGGLESITPRERRLVLWDAVRYARDLAVTPADAGLDVTAWCPSGEIELLIVDRDSSARARARWRRWLRRANLAAASRGLLTAQPMLDASARGALPAALAAQAATSDRQG
jgi:hypothetical protein